MNGYVKSRRSAGVYCMKRHINPGQKVPLDELYEQYGVSHDISPGPEFVKWLRTVKLQRRDIWEIVYDGMSITTGDEPYEALRKAEEERKAVEAAKQEAIKAEKEKKAKKAKPKVKEPEPEVEKESVVEEKAEIKKEPVEPEAGNEPDKLDKAEDGEDRSGKLKLEGEIQVDDSGGMSFSFPSEKKNLVRKDVSKRNKDLYGQVKAPKSSKKPVRARVKQVLKTPKMRMKKRLVKIEPVNAPRRSAEYKNPVFSSSFFLPNNLLANGKNT